MTEARAHLVPGKQITKAVSLLEPLDSGGMGAVWLADHQGLRTRVVVKFMLGDVGTSSARARFSREAAAAAQVKSPHVVQMLDHGVTDDGVPFIVMEHLEGHDLRDEIDARGALEPAQVVAIVSQVARALAKVHAAGLLHRDIKPDNIFVCDGEEEDELFVKLLDFGVVKSSGVDQGGTLDGETKTGQIVGTPYYMSPEQVTAQKALDHRSDLWALGVVAYEAMTGQRPYDGPSFGALAVKIATGAPPKPSEANPALPEAVDHWFAKACARDAADRFSSAREMAEALRAAWSDTVSLSHVAVNSDSGRRGLGTSSGSRAPSRSDEQATTGTDGGFELAATERGGSGAPPKDAALGQSAPASADADDATSGRRSSRLVFIGAAIALTVGGAGALAWTAQAPAASGAVATTTASPRRAATSPAPPSSSAASATASATPAARPPLAEVPEPHASAASDASVVAPDAGEAVTATAVTTPEVATPLSPVVTRPAPPHGSASTAAKASAPPVTEPSAAPPTDPSADEPPDLF